MNSIDDYNDEIAVAIVVCACVIVDTATAFSGVTMLVEAWYTQGGVYTGTSERSTLNGNVVDVGLFRHMYGMGGIFFNTLVQIRSWQKCAPAAV